MKPDVSQTFAPLAGLIAILVLVKSVDLMLAPNHVYPGRVAQFPTSELALVTAAALIGGLLAGRSPLIRVLPAQKPGGVFAVAAGVGLALGTGLAGIDLWLRIGDANVGLPLAPVFYLWGGISQEVLTHFLPVAVVVGVFGGLGATDRSQRFAFRIVALLMSTLAAVAMAQAFQTPGIPLTAKVAAAPIVIAAAVFAIELALFGMLRRHGLLSALAMRLGFYAIWHIAWPAIGY